MTDIQWVREELQWVSLNTLTSDKEQQWVSLGMRHSRWGGNIRKWANKANVEYVQKYLRPIRKESNA